MKKTLNAILILVVAGLITGCKLAVIVVEGGQVLSAGSGTCIAETICIVNVTDPYFSETFTAIPDKNWSFVKWNSGGRFLCGGSTDPNCTLSFQGYEENNNVENMVASSETFFLMPLFREVSDIIEADGREWLQPAIFRGLSWNDVEAVCSSVNGVCEGQLNGYDMDGWTWASVDDVNALFNYYIGSDRLGPGPDDFIADTDSTWADAFYEDGWLVTGGGFFPESRATAGILRELRGEGDAYEAVLSDSRPGAWYPPPEDWDTPDPFDAVITARGNPVDERIDSTGAWFYRYP